MKFMKFDDVVVNSHVGVDTICDVAAVLLISCFLFLGHTVDPVVRGAGLHDLLVSIHVGAVVVRCCS